MQKKNLKLMTRQRMSHEVLTVAVIVLLVIILPTSVFAQSKTVTGTIVDEFGESLIGVSVGVANTTRGTTSDADGKYSVKVDKGETLNFTYVGMTPQSIKVGNQSVINVTMTENATILNELVVIGYGVAKKRDLAGSIASVNASELANRPASNAVSSLQGRVSGVQIVNSGKVGENPEVKIRGMSSINGYQPLYVVDGLFAENIGYINPSDIESMEILKDPSSLAIFGVRGANGVIIVTTKQATKGKTVVNINTSFGFRKVTDKIKMTNAAQFKELYNEQLTNQAKDANKPVTLFDFSDWTADTDWQDEIFRTGFMTENNLSISTAGEKGRMYLGVGYNSSEGIIKHEKFEKVTVNFNSEYEVFKGAKVGIQFNGARILPADFKGTSVELAPRVTPVADTYVERNGVKYISNLPAMQKVSQSNPLEEVDLKANTTKALNYYGGGSIYGDISFLNDFNFRATFSMDYNSDDLRKYTPRIEIFDRDIEKADPNANPITVRGTGRTSVSQDKIDITKVQSDYILTYIKSIGKNNFTGTGGFTTFFNKYSKLSATVQDQLGSPIPNDPKYWYLKMGDPNSIKAENTDWEKTTISYLVRGLYNYDNKYILNASFRRDGSSAFYSSGKEWQNFYSFGAGWVITQENFMNSTKSVLDHMKLKASWGVLGNQNMSTAYPATTIYGVTDQAVFGKGGNETAYTSTIRKKLIDSNLGWEKITAWETGLESFWLKNRLSLDFTYYHKKTEDLITEFPGNNGAQAGEFNIGTIRNRGIELNLGWNDNIGDFRYGVSGNLTTIGNKVLFLVKDGHTIIKGDKSIAYTMAGYPIGTFWGYKVEGVYQSKEDIANSKPNYVGVVKPGDLKFADVNNDGKIDENDRTDLGSPTPKLTYGLNLNLGYKNVDLSVNMMGVSGNKIYRTWDNYNWSSFNYMSHRMDRWNGEGTSNWEPIISQSRAINTSNSDYFLEDGSFFRLRNIQLSYSFDQTLIQKLKMQSLKVFMNIENLKTWKKNTGYTPEIGSYNTNGTPGDATAFGIDKGTYPIPVVYTFGLNLTF